MGFRLWGELRAFGGFRGLFGLLEGFVLSLGFKAGLALIGIHDAGGWGEGRGG